MTTTPATTTRNPSLRPLRASPRADSKRQAALRESLIAPKKIQTPQRLNDDRGLIRPSSRIFLSTTSNLLIRRPGLEEPLLAKRPYRLSEASSPNYRQSGTRFGYTEDKTNKKLTGHMLKQAALQLALHSENELLKKVSEDSKDPDNLLRATATASESTIHRPELPPVAFKRSPERFEALTQLTKKPTMIMCRDMEEFRKRHRLGKKTKVFIVLEGYPDIRQALLRRSEN